MIDLARKKILIIATVVALVALAGFIAYTLSSSSQKKTTEQKPVITIQSSSSTPLTEEYKRQVTAGMTKLLTLKYGKGTYTVTLRDGSYSRNVSSAGVTTVRALVDLPEKNETYFFTSSSTRSYPAGTSQIFCAPEEQQLVHPSVCKDIAND